MEEGMRTCDATWWKPRDAETFSGIEKIAVRRYFLESTEFRVSSPTK